MLNEALECEGFLYEMKYSFGAVYLGYLKL